MTFLLRCSNISKPATKGQKQASTPAGMGTFRETRTEMNCRKGAMFFRPAPLGQKIKTMVIRSITARFGGAGRRSGPAQASQTNSATVEAAILRQTSYNQLRLSLSSFVEPHFLHARMRSSNFQLNRIGLIRIMTISVPQLGHADDASASGGVSGTAT
jgi:hypothetical protein